MGVLATAIGVDHALTLGGLALALVYLGVASRPTVRNPIRRWTQGIGTGPLGCQPRGKLDPTNSLVGAYVP